MPRLTDDRHPDDFHCIEATSAVEQKVPLQHNVALQPVFLNVLAELSSSSLDISGSSSAAGWILRTSRQDRVAPSTFLIGGGLSDRSSVAISVCSSHGLVRWASFLAEEAPLAFLRRIEVRLQLSLASRMLAQRH